MLSMHANCWLRRPVPQRRVARAGVRLSGKTPLFHFVMAIALTFTLAVASFRPAAAIDAVVTDISVSGDKDRVRFVLGLDRHVGFRVFALDNPVRIVVDLPEVGWRLPPRPPPGAQGIFQRVRYGLFQPGTSRAVVELSQPARIADQFMLAPGEGKPYRLVVDLERVSSAAYRRQVEAPPVEIVSLRRLDRPPPRRATAQPSVTPGGKPQSQRADGGAGRPGLPPPPRRPGDVPLAKRPMIVIDPGHGGADPGAIGKNGAYEKHVVLALARELKRQLLAANRYRVSLTRSRDVFIRLRKRIEIARDKGADMFLSLHADSIRNPLISGPSVYTLSEKASDKEAAALAERENKSDLIAGVDLSHENEEVTNILIDLAQRETLNQSARFASILVKELGRRTKVLPNPHRQAGFAVLKAPDVPSVLIESGFLSNKRDERNLTSKGYRARLAAGIVSAVDRYFGALLQARNR